MERLFNQDYKYLKFIIDLNRVINIYFVNNNYLYESRIQIHTV